MSIDKKKIYNQLAESAGVSTFIENDKKLDDETRKAFLDTLEEAVKKQPTDNDAAQAVIRNLILVADEVRMNIYITALSLIKAYTDKASSAFNDIFIKDNDFFGIFGKESYSCKDVLATHNRTMGIIYEEIMEAAKELEKNIMDAYYVEFLEISNDILNNIVWKSQKSDFYSKMYNFLIDFIKDNSPKEEEKVEEKKVVEKKTFADKMNSFINDEHDSKK